MNPTCYFLLIVCILVTPLGCDKGAFSYSVTSSSSCCPDPLYNVDMGSTVPALNYALDYVNAQPDLLPGTNLTYGDVKFAECPLTGMLLDDLLSIHNYAILGYSCAKHARTGAFIGLLFNFTPTVMYMPTSAAVLLVYPESSSEQPVLFSLHPSPDTYAASVLMLVREFGWQWLVVLTEGALFFEEVLQSLVNLSPFFNITTFQPDNSVTPEYLHITFLNMNSTAASRHLCEFSSAGRVFPSSVWITYGGNFSSSSSSSSCNSTQLLDVYDGLITVQSDPRRTTIEDISNTIMELEMMLQRVNSIVASYPLSYFAVDAVLVLAQAVNDTLTGWSNSSPDWSFCEGEESTKNASISKCFVKQKLLNIVMQGLTGPISFNSRGEREQHVLGLSQLRKTGGDTDSILVGIIQINGTENTSGFQFLQNENETTLFRGLIPNATSPIKYISKHPLAFFIVYSVMASLGNVFCIVCLLFNIIFRKRKIVRLISPNLNYFVILGAFLLYSSVYFRVYPSTSHFYANVRCNLRAFLNCVGYVLCFAPVLMKMLRVAYIFRNPTHKKKAVKDWHLILLTSIMVGIITVALVLGSIIPVFKPSPHLVEDLENPPRITEDGLKHVSCVYQCYGFNVRLVWIFLEYVYLLLLQVMAFVLALATCRVKVKVLNDSKEMLIIVYTTTMVMIVLGLITFVLPTYLVINEVLFSFGIMLATTVILGLLFIPKMVDLYRDPRGEGIFGRNTTQTQSQHVPTTNSTQESIQNGNSVVLISNSVLLASNSTKKL